MLTGSCLCGDIAFEIDGPVDVVGHCHCSMCRKSHGSAFATFVTAAPGDFRWVCGAVAFEFDDPPLRMYHCHCSRCRRAAGAAYQTLLRVRRGSFRWLGGADNVTRYRLPGTRFECAFCRTCGGRAQWERDLARITPRAPCAPSTP